MWRVAHRVLILGDMQEEEEQITSPLAMPAGFVIQKYSMEDYPYQALEA